MVAEPDTERRVKGRLPNGYQDRQSSLEKLRHISSSDLAAANLPDKGWVAVRGQVYDLTSFMTRHPGGLHIILAAVGRDCTILFEASHEEKDLRSLRYFLVRPILRTSF
jgi:cytochrome b involved in lipid metabolism